MRQIRLDKKSEPEKVMSKIVYGFITIITICMCPDWESNPQPWCNRMMC